MRRKTRGTAPSNRADIVPAIQRETITREVEDKDGTKRRVTIRRPIVMRDEWDDPDDKNDRSKTARQSSGYRRADPLILLHRRGDQITREHLRDAERYRDDFEVGVEGAKIGGGMSIGIGSGDLGMGVERLDALARYRAANAAVGAALERVLGDVVIGRQNLEDWAEKRGISRHSAVGYLVAAMDRLHDHYATLDQASLKNRRPACKPA